MAHVAHYPILWQVSADERVDAERVLLKMRLYNCLGTFLWQIKTCGVMLGGVGVKLAIYNPLSDPTYLNAEAQRVEIAAATAVCFAAQLFHCVYVKNWHNYSLAGLAAHPLHCAVVLSRVGLMVGNTVGLTQLQLEPWKFVSAQAGLAITQCVLLHLQEHGAKITSDKIHPMAALPAALKSVRHAVNERKDMVAELSEASMPPPSSRLPAPSPAHHGGAGASSSASSGSNGHSVPEGAAPNGKPANLSC